jgi:hypothetical protein
VTCSVRALQHDTLVNQEVTLGILIEDKSGLSFPGRMSYPGTLSHFTVDIVTDLINALPGNSSANTAQDVTIEEAVFSVDPTDAPTDWLDTDHVVSVYCRSMSALRLYK